MSRILIIDDEAPIREVLSANLKDEGHTVFVAGDGTTGLKAIEEHQPMIVFQDIWMPGSMDGLEVMKIAREKFPQSQFVMISGHGTIETAVKATKMGAWDFIEKPLSMDRINIAITNIEQLAQERYDKNNLLNRLRQNIAILGQSNSIQELRQGITIVSQNNESVLLVGEPGSGKSLVAQNLHYIGPNSAKPFVHLVCSSLVDDLVESDFYGYEKGAFSGALKSNKGKFEIAAGGTVYLEEVGSLSPIAQLKLLSLLKERKIKRLGSPIWIPVHFKLVCSTFKNLEKEISMGRFNEELYRLIAQNILEVPNLSARNEDSEILVKHFIDFFAREMGVPAKTFTPAAYEAIKKSKWAGNVRELKNFIERLYILTPDDEVDLHELKCAGLNPQGSQNSATPGSFRSARAQFEKEYLISKLAELGGNISKTAESIDLERSYLHRKIKLYGIEAHKDEND
jgi:two-component system nitrogen regulation response regulator NtrX